jgi:anti-sigma B factor antagonist
MRFQRTDVEAFRCEVEPRRDVVYLRPIGELDLATAPLVEEKLAELANVGFQRLVLDLRGLRFVDSTGLRLILAWHSKAREDGLTFSLVPGSATVQRLFELTSTTDLMNFVDPRDRVAHVPAVS